LRSHPLFGAYLALISVCIFWGTTYLAIRVALESIPPLALISGRFLISGTLMLTACRLLNLSLPPSNELRRTALNGVLILGAGNGCLVFAEVWIPSSLAALFISVSTFWMVGVEALVPGGEKLHGPTLAGMTVGALGAATLLAPKAIQEGFSGNTWSGFLILQLGSLSWSLGSILQKRRSGRTQPTLTAAIHQMAAGLAFLPAALLIPSAPVEWTWTGAAAILYLAVFGSIIGYSSYAIALERLPVAIVSVYTYVNPVVAAILGWVAYREPFGRREILALTIIFLGVAIVKRAASRRAPA